MSGNRTLPVISHRCLKCGFENAPRCKGQSLAMVCKTCGTYFTFGKWHKEEVKFSLTIDAYIPIGSKGKLESLLFEVVGFTVKRDTRYNVKWMEYVLFNPIAGLAYLAEYKGHWNFIRPVSGNPKAGTYNDSFYIDNNEYQLFQKYKAEIIYATGEFGFDIFTVADKSLNYEYISPPNLLTLEVSDTSSLWFKGEYITKGEVASAFKIEANKLPYQHGVGSTQPTTNVKFSDRSLISVSIILAAFVILFQIFISNTAQEKKVFEQTFSKSSLPESGEKLFVTESFVLEGGQKSLTVKIKAPIDNDWFYADLTLVNEDTGNEYNFSKEIGYYYGYEGGESWTEGSTIGEAFLSQIPGGRYHLVIYPEFSIANTFELWVVRDVSSSSNMYLTLLALAIFPIAFFIYKYNREKSRWSESDYSPYHDE